MVWWQGESQIAARFVRDSSRWDLGLYLVMMGLILLLLLILLLD